MIATSGTALRRAFGRDLARNAFGLDRATGSRERIGAEIEFIPVRADTREVCAIEGAAGPTSLELLRRHGLPRGWCEDRSSKGAPLFRLPDGAAIVFEPGGQIEYTSAPHSSPSALLAAVGEAVPPLRAAAADQGIDLLALGIDPFNSVGSAPLLLKGERYERMARYFATIGPAGAVMMRQTAAFQVCVDTGADPLRRWRLLNALAPYVVGMFANSPVHAGRADGSRSRRAANWRRVDPGRTGLFQGDGSAVDEYLDFALGARAFLRTGEVEEGFPRFGAWAADGATREDWHAHLTTLFPEVRPKGYFELRSADALDPEWYAAPLALVVGLTWHLPSQAAALDVIGAPDPALLERAPSAGVCEPGFRGRALALAELALRGCRRLGPRVFEPRHLEVAEEYFRRFTAAGRTPADDVIGRLLEGRSPGSAAPQSSIW